MVSCMIAELIRNDETRSPNDEGMEKRDKRRERSENRHWASGVKSAIRQDLLH